MKFSRKNLGRAASALLATAMLTAFTAVPASAVSPDNNGGVMDGDQTTNVVSEIKFNAQLFLPDKVPVPTANCTFTLSPAEPNGSGSTVTETVPDGSGNAIKVVKGEGIATGSASFTYTDIPVDLAQTDITASGSLDAVKDVKKVVKNVSIDISQFTFTDAGVYKYTISENELSDITEGVAETLYLYVERKKGQPVDDNPDHYVVTGAVLKTAPTGSKTTVFNSAYKLDITDPNQPINPSDPPKATANELFVSNAVTGAMGDMTDLFEYTITITAKAGNHYNAVYEKKQADGSWVEGSMSTTSSKAKVNFSYVDGSTGSGTYTAKVYLANNERIHIYGLSSGEDYTVVQTSYTTDGYTTSNTGNESGTYGQTIVNVDYTNNRDAITPTGVVVSVAPYALLVVVAAAAGFVFLRKRRED